jgi:hypothetical protein
MQQPSAADMVARLGGIQLFEVEQCLVTILFDKLTFPHAGQREKKSYFHAEITFFHAAITFFFTLELLFFTLELLFFHAGITFLRARITFFHAGDTFLVLQKNLEIS